MNRNILSALLIVCISGCAGATTPKPTRKAPPLPPAPPGMKVKKLSTTKSIASVVAPPDSQFRSAARFGDVADDSGNCVAVDRSGNVFIGGVRTVESGSPHPFLMKRSPSGETMWSNTFPGNISGSITALGVDSDGNVLVSGYFSTGLAAGAFDLGGISLVSSNASYDIFVAKLSADGTRAFWANRFGGPGGNPQGFTIDDTASGLAVDTNDNSVVVTGYYGTGVDFGGGPLPQSNGKVLFMVKMSLSNGGYKWARTIKSMDGYTSGAAVAIDNSGNIFLTGSAGSYTSSPNDFGGGPVPSLGSDGMFIAKYTKDNGYVWAKQFGASAKGRALALGGSGNVLVTGTYNLTINFGGQTLTNAPPTSPFVLPSSTFAANLSAASGAHVWSKRFGGGSASGVAVGPSGNIAIVSAGASIVNLAPDGTERWSKIFTGDNQCNSVATVNGHSYVTGRFFDTVDFGGGPVVSAGRSDIFLAEFGTSSPPVITPPGDMAISELYPDPELGSFYIVSGIQKAGHQIEFFAQDRVGGPWLSIGVWSSSAVEQRVGVSVQAGLPVRWVRSLNTPMVPPAMAMAVPIALTDTTRHTKIGGVTYKVYRPGSSPKMFVLKP